METTSSLMPSSLARISEAAVKLGSTAEELASTVPWAQVRALGNRLRHAYDTISRPTLRKIVATDLPVLREGAKGALEELRKRQSKDSG